MFYSRILETGVLLDTGFTLFKYSNKTHPRKLIFSKKKTMLNSKHGLSVMLNFYEKSQPQMLHKYVSFFLEGHRKRKTTFSITSVRRKSF